VTQNALKKNLYFILALIILGAFFVSSRFSDSPPGIIAIKADPTLLNFDDYEDKIALHTRLSTLLPNGTKEKNVIAFFKMAEKQGTSKPKGECTFFINYEDRATFIFGDNDKELKSIQVDEWPEYNEICPKIQEQPQDTPPQNEHELPLMPLPQ